MVARDQGRTAERDGPRCRCTLLRDRRSELRRALFHRQPRARPTTAPPAISVSGYFITVKHAVVALKDEDDRQSARKISSVQHRLSRARKSRRKSIDTGDADVEVHSGDWAIIKTRDELDLPALHVDTGLRLRLRGADLPARQRLLRRASSSRPATSASAPSNGLVTCLTDGHPGVSGGGVLDQRGDLVGIPIGRMQGDYRFSFILPRFAPRCQSEGLLRLRGQAERAGQGRSDRRAIARRAAAGPSPTKSW